MPNFFGKYDRSLDAKGRVILPSSVRDQLAGTGESAVYLSLGNDYCIAMHAESDWMEKVETLKRNATSKTRPYIRLLFANTFRVVPDRQGRIPIPAELLGYAGLDVERARDLVIAGAMDRFELWERGRWTRFIEEHEAGRTLQDFDFIEFGGRPPDRGDPNPEGPARR